MCGRWALAVSDAPDCTRTYKTMGWQFGMLDTPAAGANRIQGSSIRSIAAGHQWPERSSAAYDWLLDVIRTGFLHPVSLTCTGHACKGSVVFGSVLFLIRDLNVEGLIHIGPAA